MEYIVACHDPALLKALRAFADQLARCPIRRPAGRAPRPARAPGHAAGGPGRGCQQHARGGRLTHDHQAWFRLWLPLGRDIPSRDTYLRLMHRLDPETAMQAALLLLDDTSLPGLLRDKIGRHLWILAAALP